MADATELASELAEMIGNILYEEVDPTALSALLIEDYGANSMDRVDIADQVERRFRVKIANDQISKLVTFGDIVNLVAGQTPR